MWLHSPLSMVSPSIHFLTQIRSLGAIPGSSLAFQNQLVQILVRSWTHSSPNDCLSICLNISNPGYLIGFLTGFSASSSMTHKFMLQNTAKVIFLKPSSGSHNPQIKLKLLNIAYKIFMSDSVYSLNLISFQYHFSCPAIPNHLE